MPQREEHHQLGAPCNTPPVDAPDLAHLRRNADRAARCPRVEAGIQEVKLKGIEMACFLSIPSLRKPFSAYNIVWIDIGFKAALKEAKSSFSYNDCLRYA